MTTMLLDPVDELTRRRLLGGAAGLGVLTVLPACASDDGSSAGSGAAKGGFPSGSTIASGQR